MSSFFLLSAYCLVGEGGTVKVQYSINKTYHVNLPVASAVLSCKGGGPYNFYQFLYLQQHSLPCQPSSYYQRKILFLQKHNLPSPTSRLPWYSFYMFLHVFTCVYMCLHVFTAASDRFFSAAGDPWPPPLGTWSYYHPCQALKPSTLSMQHRLAVRLYTAEALGKTLCMCNFFKKDVKHVEKNARKYRLRNPTTER